MALCLIHFLFFISIALIDICAVADACQACVAPLPFLPIRQGRRHGVRGLSMMHRSSSLPFLGLVSGHQIAENWVQRVKIRMPRQVVVPALVVAGILATRTVLRNALLLADDAASQDDHKDSDPSKDNTSEKANVEKNNDEELSSALMIGTIRFYKSFISPLLPPACRFLPTCSQYGVQAIEEFGPTKGAILTAWRLLRCSPLGGRGYDPPKWPPVFYTYGSY